jgi:hypothetical protein
MALEAVAITAGSGTNIAVDTGATGNMQIVKLASGMDASEDLIPGDTTNGLDVDVTRVQGSVTVAQATATNLKVDASGVAVPITDNAGSLTVDAPVATPVFVRLSDGSAAITALPITDNSGSITVDDGATTLSVDDGGGALTVDGTLTAVTTVGTITNAVTVQDGGGAISVDDNAGSLTVDGTVTATQGTAAASSGGWPVKITDGTDNVGVSTVGSDKAIKVDVIQAASQAVTGTVTANQGTANATPWTVDIDQVGGNSVATAASGIAKVGLTDESGSAFSETNPMPVRSTILEKTPVRKGNTISASETAVEIWTPTSGKKFIIDTIISSMTVAGKITIFDNTNAAGNVIAVIDHAAAGVIAIGFSGGHPSSTVNNVLRYTTGTGITGTLTILGYESA